MSVLQSIPLSADVLKMRWEEPYVTAGLNTKNLSVHPKGVIAGFRVVPNAGFTVTVQVDPTLNVGVANVLETTGGFFSVTIVQNSNINIDLTAQANSTVFIVLDAQYVIGANTTGQVKVVDAAELASNLDLVVLAKVNVPNVGPVLATHINMGYRLSAGDFTPMEAFQAANLIPNGGFEANTVAGWTNNGFDTAAASTDTARTGTYSLKLIKTVAGTPFITTSTIGVLPGRKYKAGAWVRSTGGSPIASGNGAKVQVSFFDVAGSIIGSPVDIESAFSGGGTTFIQKLAEVTAPALAFTATLRIFFDGSSGTLYVDDAQFVSYFTDSLVQSNVIYNGGGNWADGTPNPATTIEGQLDKIISDLAGASGAPKIGNAPSKILANTFTQLNTFQAGIAINTLQNVAWPNWLLEQLDDKNWKIEATDSFAVTRQFNFLARTTGGPPDMKFEMSNPLTPYTFKIETGFFSGASARLGSEEDGAIKVRINAGDRWTFGDSFSNYDLIAGGSQIGNVTNLRPPTSFTEAARRNYVDSGDAPNLVINGDFGIWQRESSSGVGPDTPLSVIAGGANRRYLPDRWYLYNEAAGGAREISRQLASGVNSPQNMKYCVKVQRPNGNSNTNKPHLVQELDRTMLRKVITPESFANTTIFRFWLKVGANFSAAGGTLEFGVVSAPSATPSLWFGAPYNGGGVSTQYVQLTPTTDWAQYTVSTLSLNFPTAAAIIFRYTPVGTASFEDWFEVTGVEARPLTFGVKNELDVATFSDYMPFKLAGGSPAGEQLLCEQYYEKSYDRDTPPGTVTSSGQHRILATGSGLARYAPGVRYATRKQPYAPSYTNWFTYDPGTGNGGPGVGNLGHNYTGPVADFGLDSPNEGGEMGFNIDQDVVPAAGDVIVIHWTSDCDF